MSFASEMEGYEAVGEGFHYILRMEKRKIRVFAGEVEGEEAMGEAFH